MIFSRKKKKVFKKAVGADTEDFLLNDQPFIYFKGELCESFLLLWPLFPQSSPYSFGQHIFTPKNPPTTTPPAMCICFH